ncbi:exostosin family protein [Paraglaciecola chathamensis]|uniref:exostosin domain-containing protein n=1 Tax=Paraglaciecola chathamensis TaxID=368405 RepID=UPI0026F664C1|nr:exostosin family protein [Paraglaciecola chathamensis]MDO6838023.1 exostosin family protein [Paraglaciecola chathamensis]
MQIIEINTDWQYPAITEKHAYEKIKSLRIQKDNVCYIAFPWATYIDKVKNGKDADFLLSELKLKISKYDFFRFSKVVTVCQHIRMLDIAELLIELGISDIFWSHKVKDENSFNGINIHPFPLYPTQILELDPKPIEKDILYSFVGATSNQWYLTNSRKLILDTIESKSDVIIKGREKWHYNDIVYKQQVQGVRLENHSITENDRNTQEYLEVMRRSKYALCPSGSGPNSIRLWECVEMGIIPVLLADTYDAPNKNVLFESCIVRVAESETGIKGIDELIRSIPEEKYIAMLNNLLSLKLLYGKDGFIYDLVQFVFNVESKTTGFLDMVSNSPRVLAVSLSSKILLQEIENHDDINAYAGNVLRNSKKAGINSVNILKEICELRGLNFP